MSSKTIEFELLADVLVAFLHLFLFFLTF